MIILINLTMKSWGETSMAFFIGILSMRSPTGGSGKQSHSSGFHCKLEQFKELFMAVMENHGKPKWLYLRMLLTNLEAKFFIFDGKNA